MARWDTQRGGSSRWLLEQDMFGAAFATEGAALSTRSTAYSANWMRPKDPKNVPTVDSVASEQAIA